VAVWDLYCYFWWLTLSRALCRQSSQRGNFSDKHGSLVSQDFQSTQICLARQAHLNSHELDSHGLTFCERLHFGNNNKKRWETYKIAQWTFASCNFKQNYYSRHLVSFVKTCVQCKSLYIEYFAQQFPNNTNKVVRNIFMAFWLSKLTNCTPSNLNRYLFVQPNESKG
jgi:hypothetical protein